MIELHVTHPAFADLREIESYLLERSEQATARVMRELWAAFERIAAHPYLGHERPDIDLPDVRCWVVYSYVVVYRPTANLVEILRVIHGARDVSAALETEP